MKIYTRTGDSGKTSLFGGQRVAKDTVRIEAYGCVDELNSHLGVVRALDPPLEIALLIDRIQHELFILGADLATPHARSTKKINRIETQHIKRLEKDIDMLDSALDPLQQFILPGGSGVAAALHVARTVCRRTERRIVQLSRKSEIGSNPIVYINRLSDFLFVAARSVNKLQGVEERKWDSHEGS